MGTLGSRPLLRSLEPRNPGFRVYGSALWTSLIWESLGSVCAVVQFGHLLLGKAWVPCVRYCSLDTSHRQPGLVEIASVAFCLFPLTARLGFSFAHELVCACLCVCVCVCFGFGASSLRHLGTFRVANTFSFQQREGPSVWKLSSGVCAFGCEIV